MPKIGIQDPGQEYMSKQIYFALAMFPYPSGAGLHVGHAENFIYVDVMARFQKMQGKQVINPIGRDAFGLPTENYALKQGKPAHIVTQENIDNFIAQCKLLDLDLDREREINTSQASYYKWTQWMFAKLFEKGLAYRKDAFVNRCQGCQTVLANDQVKEGKCERCETDIIQKKHPQRFIKITDYAEKLINDLNLVDRPEETKAHQKNRIGKSEGLELSFEICQTQISSIQDGIGPIKIYTTRPETLYGVTAVMLAPENEILDHILDAETMTKLQQYREQTASKTNLERQHTDKNKTGFNSGISVRHPLTQAIIPVWYADYVLADYATGAVMFVPAHDERDYAFAQAINSGSSSPQLKIKQVIAPSFAQETHPDLVHYRRDTVRAIIKHPSEDLYLFLTANDNKARYVGGGIDDGLSLEESLIKEIAEETGYTDIIIRKHILTTYFCKHTKSKGINSYGSCHYYDCQLTSLTQDPISAEESSKHQAVWLSPAQIQEQYRHIGFVRDYYQSGSETLYLGDGVMINCENGIDFVPVSEAKELIIQAIEKAGVGHRQINYKLRDRSVSRQRYRGSPIPIYYTFEDNQKVAYFEGTGDRKPQLNSSIITRKLICAIVKHHSEEKYLFAKRNNSFGLTFVGGGMAIGETIEAAGMREVKEETGYQHITYIKTLDTECHSNFYAIHKNEGRYAIQHTIVVELENDEHIDPTQEQHDDFELIWLYKEDIKESMMLQNNWYIWQTYLHDQAPEIGLYVDRYNVYNPHPDKSKWVPHLMPESELPVILPLDVDNYKPAGKSPLEDHQSFKYYHAPDGTIYLRECDTLDTFMCSTYYYLRFLDPHNTHQVIDPAIEKVAMPVDFYMGGKEHTVGHLLYSRFIYKFLYDCGYVSHAEPFAKLVHQGMVLASDGRKMSKRRGNIINPSEVIGTYGVDAVRTYIAFMGPVEQDKCRNDHALSGVKKFLERVTRLQTMIQDDPHPSSQTIVHQTIKGVTEDIQNLKYNTVISKLMILTNHFYEVKTLTHSDYEILLLLLSPFASKLSQELWSQIGHIDDIHIQTRPIYDPNLIVAQDVTYAIQINGKMRGTLTTSTGLTQEEVLQQAQADSKIVKYIVGPIKKCIFVQDKILNMIVG